VRLEIEVELQAKVYEYVIAFELPEGFKELRGHHQNTRDERRHTIGAAAQIQQDGSGSFAPPEVSGHRREPGGTQ
jgi:hypothetical protein